MKSSQIRRGRTIHRQTGTTFYYATRLHPDRVRDEVYVLYGFFRLADEVVDGADFATAEDQRARLAAMREAALGRRSAEVPVVAAFTELVADAAQATPTSAGPARYSQPDARGLSRYRGRESQPTSPPAVSYSD